MSALAKLFEAATNSNLVRSFLKYMVLGGAIFVCSLGLVAGLVEFIGMSPISAGAVGFATSFLLNFAAARFAVFHSEGSPFFRQLLSFAAVSGALRLVEYSVYWSLITYVKLPYYLVFFIVLIASNALKFFVYKTVVFGEGYRQENQCKKI